MKANRALVLAAAVVWTGICEAAYPGNPNFRNLAVTYAAKTRTSWETNAVTASLSRTSGSVCSRRIRRSMLTWVVMRSEIVSTSQRTGSIMPWA